MKEISKVVLGTCYYGGTVDRKTSLNMLDRYYELGGRTLDTARMYLDRGVYSEEVLGEWLKSSGVRGDMTLVTKGGYPGERIDRDSIYEDINTSIELLGSEPDIYLLHRDNPGLDVSVPVTILDELIKNGLTRRVGVSNWTTERIARANRFATDNGMNRLSVSQLQWSLADTDSEKLDDLTLVCMDENEYNSYLSADVEVMAYSAQAKGFFSKYLAGQPFGDKIDGRFVSEENIARAERVGKLGKELGAGPAAVALAYIFSGRLKGAPIIGCSNVAQLEDSMTAMNISLTTEQCEWLLGR